ncbi:MAG: uridine phosphorylase [Bdellovibrionaceae bacterium]|nr:uridine phosphorylase [Pseudobdellovibrionaceae bacterium]
MSSKTHVHHLDLSSDQIKGIRLAIIPGDPDRVDRIAEELEDVQPLAHKREFKSVRGRVGDHPILITSTGIGGPSTSICVEELSALGVTHFLRIGSTGSIQPHINTGDIILSTGAVRRDGASHDFAPINYPAIADFSMVRALAETAESMQATFHTGISVTTDTFYTGQERYDTSHGYVRKKIQGSLEEYRHLNCLNFEMETSILYTMAQVMGLKAANVLGVAAKRTDSEEVVPPDQFLALERKAIQIAVQAIPRILQN